MLTRAGTGGRAQAAVGRGPGSGHVDDHRMPARRPVRHRRAALLGLRRAGPVGGPALQPCRPGARSSPARHIRHVSWFTSVASCAACHGPSSARTSTFSTPVCWAHAVPASTHPPGGERGEPAGPVDPRLGLDRRLPRPPALHPVGVAAPRRSSTPGRSPTSSPRRSRRGPGRPCGPGTRARAAAPRRSSRRRAARPGPVRARRPSGCRPSSRRRWWTGSDRRRRGPRRRAAGRAGRRR